MREFRDVDGEPWVASIRERDGDDYKGRYCFFFYPGNRPEEEGVPLVDVRWNSPQTAKRTLTTMSEVELQKRLKVAQGRTG